MLLTLLSMGAAIALIPASALAMPAEPKELAELFDAVPIPSTLSAQDDFASGALSIVHAPQKTSRAFSREVEFDSLVQGILPASDRNTIAAHVRETLISREPLTKASGIPENFDASFNPLWSPPQLLVNELAQVVPTNDWRGNAVIPFNPTPRLSKSAIETPSSDYFELNANFSVFLAQLPAQLTVNELAQAAPTDEVNEDRLPSFIDPEPPPNELTVEEGAAPEYLNPDPNPLLFPTQPEEVDIIGAQPITLEQAIELAYRNNEDLQVALLQLDQSLSALRQAQAALFPTLNLTSDVTAQENTATSTGAASDRDVDINLNGRLRLSYDVFTSGARSGNIGAAERQVRFNELQVEVIQENLRLDTSNDYYDLQNAVEQIRINQAFLEEAEQNLRDTSLREEVGVGTRFDVLRAEVQVADARQDLVQAQSNKEIAQRALAQRLNLPPSLDISATPVEVAEPWPLSLEESIVLAFQNRAELEQQLVLRELNEQQRRVALAALGPTISLVADYNFTDTLNQSGEIQDTYSVGAQLTWNLFEGGAAAASAAQEERDIEIAETNFSDSRNQIRFDVEQSYYNLEANKVNIKTAELSVEQAGEALELANLRLDAGVGTQLDVLTAQSELTDAEVNLVNAILGYNRSLAALQRAVSNLSNPSSEQLY